MFIARTMFAIAAIALTLAVGVSPASQAKAMVFTPIHFTVIDEGTTGKPDVILIPGLTSGRWVWKSEAAKLAPDYRLHLLQVNGFAGQPAGANATTDPLLPAIVDELHAYIAVHRMRPIVIGHSLGGLLGLMLAQKYPQDADRLVIVDASPFWGLMFGPKSTVESVRPMAVRMRDSTLAQSPAQRAVAERQIAETLVLDPEIRQRIASDGMISDPQTAARALYEDLQTDLRPLLATINTPTLVLYAYDPTLTFPGGTEPTREMADAVFGNSYRLLPNVELSRVESSRHFIMADQPQKLDEMVRSFLFKPAKTSSH